MRYSISAAPSMRCHASARSSGPNFFIIGAPKCGTTSMCDWLSRHPNIFMAAEKEPHFFNTDEVQGVKTPAAYRELFRHVQEHHKAVGEASVWYLYSRHAVENILKFNPQARFIVMLRNPIEMAPSLHSEMVISGHESVGDFFEAWELQGERRLGRRLPAWCRTARRLLYGDVCSLGAQLEKLLTIVPESAVLPVLLDDMARDPRAEYLRVLRFLELDDDGRTEFPVRNKARVARFPRLVRPLFIGLQIKNMLRVDLGLRVWTGFSGMAIVRPRYPVHPGVKAALSAHFAEDVQRLGSLLRRDLAHWLTPAPP